MESKAGFLDLQELWLTHVRMRATLSEKPYLLLTRILIKLKIWAVLRVYPNPANNNITVSYELEQSREILISLHDFQIKQLSILTNAIKKSPGMQLETIYLRDINPGLYLIVIESDKNEQAVQRLIVEK